MPATRYELPELHIRLNISEGNPLYSTREISTPQDAVVVMADMMKQLDREHVCVVNLDNKLRPINFNIVSIGSINESMVPMQNLFKSNILSQGKSIIVLHNHPAGTSYPSEEDYAVTKKMIEAGKILDIPMLDHIIVAGYSGDTYSMREEDEGVLSFQETSGTYSVKESSAEDWRQRRKERMERMKKRLFR